MNDLSKYIKCYDNVLPRNVCDKMIELFESRQDIHIANGATARAGLEDSLWTEINVAKISDRTFQEYMSELVIRYKSQYESDCGIAPELPQPSSLAQLVLKRYNVGNEEKFQVHFDSIREVCNRYLVFLWYLNDVEQGGETEFPDIGVKIKPRMGRLLIFPPYWMYRHAGLPPISNTKYIFSTYALW